MGSDVANWEALRLTNLDPWESQLPLTRSVTGAQLADRLGKPNLASCDSLRQQEGEINFDEVF